MSIKSRIMREVGGFKSHGYRVHTASEFFQDGADHVRVPVLAKREHADFVSTAFSWLAAYRKEQRERYLALAYLVIRTPYRGQVRYVGTSSRYPIVLDSESYFRTEEWGRVVRAVKRRDRVCRICGTGICTEAHHNSYEHFGEEMDHLEDVTLLCRFCHHVVHKYIVPTKRSLPAKRSLASQ